ncbi:MAG: hypothetical protein A3K19_26410 [Lentisphaerae bacterium RIFOXYB12_FULL_65_16]|nr:MAG: hypothetical protein A3K18_08580 [Lentisphaerae bacterium RIFOXYA12_64_32]OGV87808.1 MAG: hypothetical protein A3K19_26410 [Lentisphaerae bacterium RIFOXYB12_FULL_65_16]
MHNIAFVGCGGIARHHASKLASVQDARIVAVSDVSSEAAEKFAKDFGADGCKTFSNYKKMLKLDTVQSVWVCTPTFLHAKPVIAAAQAGKHVFCEKPMAMKLSDACRMAEACDKAGVLLTVGFVRRFDAFWGKMKDIVQSGAIGRPVIWRFAAGGKPGNPWFRDVKKGGGPLLDGAVHNYDFALQMFGPVASVQASSRQFDPTSVGDDTASVIIDFASGDQHTLIWSWGMAKGAECTSLCDIIGPLGSLQFGMTAKEPPQGFDPQTQGAFTVKTADGAAQVFTYPKQDMFVDQARHVVESFSQGKQPLVTARDGIESLKVGAAILKAGVARRTIKL